MHFTLVLSSEEKNLLSLIQFCHCGLKSRKTYRPQFREANMLKKITEGRR